MKTKDDEAFKKLNASVDYALTQLAQNDWELIVDDVDEVSICHKIAEYLARKCSNFHVDIEYNRSGGGESPKSGPLGEMRKKLDIILPLDEIKKQEATIKKKLMALRNDLLQNKILKISSLIKNIKEIYPEHFKGEKLSLLKEKRFEEFSEDLIKFDFIDYEFIDKNFDEKLIKEICNQLDDGDKEEIIALLKRKVFLAFQQFISKSNVKVRPDIIIHKRRKKVGICAFEVKKGLPEGPFEPKDVDKIYDLVKLMIYRDVLKYPYCMMLCIEKNTSIEETKLIFKKYWLKDKPESDKVGKFHLDWYLEGTDLIFTVNRASNEVRKSDVTEIGEIIKLNIPQDIIEENRKEAALMDAFCNCIVEKGKKK